MYIDTHPPGFRTDMHVAKILLRTPPGTVHVASASTQSRRHSMRVDPCESASVKCCVQLHYRNAYIPCINYIGHVRKDWRRRRKWGEKPDQSLSNLAGLACISLVKFVDLAVTTDARGHLFLFGYNYPEQNKMLRFLVAQEVFGSGYLLILATPTGHSKGEPLCRYTGVTRKVPFKLRPKIGKRCLMFTEKVSCP